MFRDRGIHFEIFFNFIAIIKILPEVFKTAAIYHLAIGLRKLLIIIKPLKH